jgi:predicted O-methyltransferase YrrM
MSQALWTAVDDYITGTLIKQDYALEAALEESRAAGLPPYNISAPQGQFLHILVRSINARRILEIGTLGGYSTIWMAYALPENGKIVTLEVDENCARVAHRNFERAGLNNKIELVFGRALETLPALIGPFDMIFIDADKQNNPDYFKWAMKYIQPGGVIIVDNVVREGTVIEEDSDNASVIGTRRLNKMIADEPRVKATVIQTVSSKGYDGFLMATVK